MKRSERIHMGKVSELPCSLCGEYPPSMVHHIREGQGMSQRASAFLTIPLCYPCHQGENGVHGSRDLLRTYKQTELTLLASTIEKLTNGD